MSEVETAEVESAGHQPVWVHRRKPTVEQDLAEAPSWASARGSTSVRQKNAATLCAFVSGGELPPVLINRANRPETRNPAYVIPTWLWNLICDQYPEMRPEESLIYEATATYYRNDMWAKILRPAYESGQHTFVYSVGNPAEEVHSWEVYFSPRRWVEEGVRRLVEDRLIDEAQMAYWVRRAAEDREFHAEETSPATQAEVRRLSGELTATRRELADALESVAASRSELDAALADVAELRKTVDDLKVLANS